MIEWDDDKNRSNLVKHGLDFGDAEKVFAGKANRREQKIYQKRLGSA